jgi:hypothetical protein
LVNTTLTYNVTTQLIRTGYYGTIQVNLTSYGYITDGPPNTLTVTLRRDTGNNDIIGVPFNLPTTSSIIIAQQNSLLNLSSALLIGVQQDPSYRIYSGEVFTNGGIQVATPSEESISSLTYKRWTIPSNLVNTTLTYNVTTQLIRTGWSGTIDILLGDDSAVYSADSPTSNTITVTLKRGSNSATIGSANVVSGTTSSITISSNDSLLNINSPLFIDVEPDPNYGGVTEILATTEIGKTITRQTPPIGITASYTINFQSGRIEYLVQTTLIRTGYYGFIQINWIGSSQVGETLTINIKANNVIVYTNILEFNGYIPLHTITEGNRLLNPASLLLMSAVSSSGYEITSEAFSDTGIIRSTPDDDTYKRWLIPSTLIEDQTITYNVITQVIRTGYYGDIELNWRGEGTPSNTLSVTIKANNVVVYTSNPISSYGFITLHTITEGNRLINPASLLLMSVQTSPGYDISSQEFSDVLITRSLPDDGTYKRWLIHESLIENQNITYTVMTKLSGTGYYGIISVRYTLAQSVVGNSPYIVVHLLNEYKTEFLPPVTFTIPGTTTQLFEITQENRLSKTSSYLYIGIEVTNTSSWVVQSLYAFNNNSTTLNPNFIDNGNIPIDGISYVAFTIPNTYIGPVTFSIQLDKM